MAGIEPKHLLVEMGKVGKELVRRLRISLSRSGKNASGNLSRSLQYEQYKQRGEVKLDILAADYADFVNKGVRGAGPRPPSQVKNPTEREKRLYDKRMERYRKNVAHYRQTTKSKYRFKRGKRMVPPSEIEKWLVKRGVQARNPDTGRFQSRKSAAIALATAIHARGLKPTYFIDRVLEKMEKELPGRLAKAYDKDIQDYLDKL